MRLLVEPIGVEIRVPLVSRTVSGVDPHKMRIYKVYANLLNNRGDILA